MADRLLLDSGPLGRLCRPNGRSPLNREVARWFVHVLEAGNELIVPEIADYELRRELIRAGLTQSIRRLDSLKEDLTYLPLDTATMLLAAELWATARNQGTPTADPKELDGDVVLASQARHAGAIVVTDNVGHLSRFVTARQWRDVH